jgi:polyketide biosynthesis enoyl-CoA hydratase PksI
MNEVVRLTYPEEEIAVIAMEDREQKNMFSSALVDGLLQVFDEIKYRQQTKVVVIHGYDNYFSCGGTKQELLKIFNGSRIFTDLKFYDLLLNCELPTIAAMQGHAIGGGLAFACYADIIILSRESIYSANFMKYGFTPGLGATYIIPEKFGNVIGTEMLLCAKTYSGRVLKEMGIPLQVIERKYVIERAMEIAKELSDKPLTSLKVLKKHLTQKIRAALPEIINQELELHRKTFTQEEVKVRVEKLFGK